MNFYIKFLDYIIRIIRIKNDVLLAMSSLIVRGLIRVRSPHNMLTVSPDSRNSFATTKARKDIISNNVTIHIYPIIITSKIRIWLIDSKIDCYNLSNLA